MSFLGLRNDLALRIVDWGLPGPIIVRFAERLSSAFAKVDPQQIPSSRKLGMNTNIVVTDPDDSTRRYIFFIRLARNDDDFWVSDVDCLGVDATNRIFWTHD
ncbi:MAG: hypothetical protein RIC55_12055 [Pirellulaceae bacterium]